MVLVIAGISLGLRLASEKASEADSSDPRASFFGVTPSLAVWVAGQGSKAIVETETSAFGASGGLFFPVEIAGFSLRIEPGVSWMFYIWELAGRVLRALRETEFCPGGNFRGIGLLDRKSFDSHGVGPYHRNRTGDSGLRSPAGIHLHRGRRLLDPEWPGRDAAGASWSASGSDRNPLCSAAWAAFVAADRVFDARSRPGPACPTLADIRSR